MATSKQIAWSKLAFKQFENIYNYIFEDSEQNAEKVRKEIIDQKVGPLNTLRITR